MSSDLEVSREEAAAYGGSGWSPRERSFSEELGKLWAGFRVNSEYASLQAVLLHRPGDELDRVQNPNDCQFLARPDPETAQKQHDAMAQAYRAAGVIVHAVNPQQAASPNLMFVADLMFMTSEGAILGRPASNIRAGEERHIARALADLGVPILRTVRGRGTFEGADACWLDPKTVLLATGLRTNAAGAEQVATTLAELGVQTVRTSLDTGSMHLMSCLRIVDRDLAVVWDSQLPATARQALRAHGYQVSAAPDEEEIIRGSALNFVTLAPRQVLMADGNPQMRALLARLSVEVHTVAVDELSKAAGAIGCLTGVLARAGE